MRTCVVPPPMPVSLSVGLMPNSVSWRSWRDRCSRAGCRGRKRGGEVVILLLARIVAVVAGLVVALSVSQPLAQAQMQTLCVHGVAAGHHLHMRATPGADARSVARLSPGDCGIKLVGRCEASWCLMSRRGREGWIDTRYVGVYEYPSRRTRPRVAVERIERAPARYRSRRISGTGERWCVVRVASFDTLRLRTGPGVRHREIGRIPPGSCQVRRLGACQGGWCRVAWNGRRGWVNRFYLSHHQWRRSPGTWGRGWWWRWSRRFCW